MTPEEAYNRADTLIKQGEISQAVDFLTKALERFSEDANLYSLRAVSYFHLRKKNESLHDINKSLELEPHYSYRYSSRAFIKDAFGDIRGAIEDYKMCIALDPEDAVAYNNLGLLEEKLGYTAKAQQRFKKADKLAGIEPKTYTPILEEKQPEKTPSTPEKEQNRAKIIAGVFRKKETFKEFLTFIGKGFKS